MIVIDASVIVKLFLNEPGTAAARALLRSSADALRGPDLLAIEAVAALVRKANADKSQAMPMRAKLAALSSLLESGITLVRTSPSQIAHAAEQALALGHPLKDCIYLALANELDCPLVTADARFAAKAQSAGAKVDMLGG